MGDFKKYCIRLDRKTSNTKILEKYCEAFTQNTFCD